MVTNPKSPWRKAGKASKHVDRSDIIARVTRERKEAEGTNPRKLLKPSESLYEQNELADDMIEWSKLETSLVIEDYPLSKNISPYKFFKLALNNEYFDEALQFARAMIASRSYKKAVNREVDGSMVMKMMPLYNPEYREFLREKSAIEGSKQNPIQVIIEQSPSVDSVKALPVREE